MERTMLTFGGRGTRCCEVGGSGGGGMIGGVGVVCGDGVDSGVRGVVCGVVCGVVKAPISTMIVNVPEKDRWCGMRGRDVIVDGGGGDDIKHDTSVECFYYKTQGHVTIVFELQHHQGDQDVDAKGNGYYTWMAFGGNTRDLGSFGEETDKTTTLHQILKEVVHTECGDGVACFKRRRQDIEKIISLASEVSDIVLVITPSYELGFQRFNSPRNRSEKIYNYEKNDTAMASGFLATASRLPT
ncbi:hypothetical protein Tco_1556076 [Tanacetum coccineum]